MFLVDFSRIGTLLPPGRHFKTHLEAKSVEALEGPITGLVEDALAKGEARPSVTVTIDPENMKGQLNYGLLGNFTITAA